MEPSASLTFKPVEVSKALQVGEKFIKWDEDSSVGVPVTLKVDAKGFFLYWIDQNLDMDLLDIATIRDVRTGQHAKIPKDPKLRSVVQIGSQGTLEDKTVTVCHATDFVNINFINFCCAKKEIAQVWTEELFALAYNLNQANNATISFLEKMHTKILLSADKAGKLLVKNIVKMFASQHKEDKKRVEKALGESGHPTGKNDMISVTKFQFEDFFSFYKVLTQRTEVQKIFDEITDAKTYMTASQFVLFLNNTQRDPRLNEILHPYADLSRATELIRTHELSKYHRQRNQLTFNGFLRYLMSADNPIVSSSKLELCDDMEQSLAHYYINSSHNTYLTGHQITGKSSVEIYRQCLLAGCRCVELDFWNGRTDEPIIVHGYTFVPEISAKDVLEAIAESAFKTSEYPVILSFENHCNPRQQAKIAQYCRDIFGDMLLDKPLDSHQLEPGGELPPPSMLKRKIIIKNKKKHHHKKQSVPASPTQNGDLSNPPPRPESSLSSETDSLSEDDIEHGQINMAEEGLMVTTENGDQHIDDVKPVDVDKHNDIEKDLPIPGSPGADGEPDPHSDQKESHAGAEISALVNYIQPVHFTSFENAEKKNKFYEMSSFDEKQATNLLKECPVEFINYNKIQLSRVYPQGTRFDSSNFMPQVFWNAGCQLVALNYQTLDLAMQLNLGFFEYNRRCGYVLKPEFMRRKDRLLDPFTESTVDGIIAGSVSVTIISGQLLCERRIGTYVEVDMFGLPADSVRRRFKTRLVPNNGINPYYGLTPFLFKKVVLPELAMLRLAAYEEGGRLIGHRVLPVVGLRPGYRHLNLRTEIGQPLTSSLFMHIVVKDYVPDGMSELAEALANPIKYQSDLDKRGEQLARLTEDNLPDEKTALKPIAPKKRTASTVAPHSDDILEAPIDLNKTYEHSPSQELTISDPNNEQVSSETQTITKSEVSSNNQQIMNSEVTIGISVLPSDSQPMINQVLSANKLISKQEPSATPDEPSELSALSQPKSNAEMLDTSQELVIESVESVMASKPVKEKRSEMTRKLESLSKKKDKERRLSSKFYVGNKLVKRLSSKNMSTSEDTPCTSEFSEKAVKARCLAAVYSAADKHLMKTQHHQMKMLKAQLDRDTHEAMRKIQAKRREDVKALSRMHKGEELERLKRELSAQVVERGVSERVRLGSAYEQKREALARLHERVRAHLAQCKILEEMELGCSEDVADESGD